CDMRVHDGPSFIAKPFHQYTDVLDGIPCDFAASRGELLDGFFARYALGAGGSVLHIDYQQRRPLSHAQRPAESGSARRPLIGLSDEFVPNPRHTVSSSTGTAPHKIATRASCSSAWAPRHAT